MQKKNSKTEENQPSKDKNEKIIASMLKSLRIQLFYVIVSNKIKVFAILQQSLCQDEQTNTEDCFRFFLVIC